MAEYPDTFQQDHEDPSPFSRSRHEGMCLLLSMFHSIMRIVVTTCASEAQIHCVVSFIPRPYSYIHAYMYIPTFIELEYSPSSLKLCHLIQMPTCHTSLPRVCMKQYFHTVWNRSIKGQRSLMDFISVSSRIGTHFDTDIGSH